MTVMKKQVAGVSLIEVILAIAVGMAILILSVRQYYSFRKDADIQQLQYNVDTIFQAMSDYYKTNCYGTTSPTTGKVTGGKLNPSLNPQNIVVLSIQTDLVNNGFLTLSIPPNPLVNSASTTAGPATSSPFNGYVIQFNKATQTRSVCTVTNCAKSGLVGTSYIWMAQVAVLMKDTKTVQQLANTMGATCISSVGAGGGIAPCTAAAGSGNYIVFQRLPSMASPTSASPLWSTNPNVEGFTQMYTTYPTVYLLNTQGILTAQPGSTSQTYLCGS